MSPLITIIIPILDVERFLPECIDSVLAQTFKDWELVLVDDGSRNHSIQIARSYAGTYPDRIRFIASSFHEPQGPSSARNLGRQYARGKWIAYLDSDDIWVPHKLEQQVDIIYDHPEVGMVIGGTTYWHRWGDDLTDSVVDEVVCVGAPLDRVYEPPSLINLLYPLGIGAAPSMNTVLVRTDLVDQVGGGGGASVALMKIKYSW